MQKTVVRNPNQSQIRRNLLNIAGITIQGETITPQNGDRLLGGYGVAWLNNQDAASQTTGQDNPLPECNCESGGGGGGSGGGGVQPSGNCEKKNISELKQVLDDYANKSFCDKALPDVKFSTFIGYDKPPLSNSTAKEIELRMLCPVDDCQPKGRFHARVMKRLKLGNEQIIYDYQTVDIYDMSVSDGLAWIYDYFEDACSGYIEYGQKLQACEYCSGTALFEPCKSCQQCSCIAGCNYRTIILTKGGFDHTIQFNCNTPSSVYLQISCSASLYFDDGTSVRFTDDMVDFSRYGTI